MKANHKVFSSGNIHVWLGNWSDNLGGITAELEGDVTDADGEVWKVYRVGMSHIKEELRNKGYGKLLYSTLLEVVSKQGGWLTKDFLSGTTPAAKRVWDSLIKVTGIETKTIKPQHVPANKFSSWTLLRKGSFMRISQLIRPPLAHTTTGGPTPDVKSLVDKFLDQEPHKRLDDKPSLRRPGTGVLEDISCDPCAADETLSAQVRHWLES